MCKIDYHKIDSSFCFRTSSYSMKQVNDSLDYYEKNLKDRNAWVFDDKETIVFVDTNVLLNLYEISDQERDEILAFFIENRDRVFIPSQVQREFLRRRIAQIQKKQQKLSNLALQTKNDLSFFWKNFTDIEGKLTGIMNQGIVKYGMPDTFHTFEELRNLLKRSIYTNDNETGVTELTSRIIESIQKECVNIQDKSKYDYKDPILSTLSQLTILPELSDDDEKFTKELFDKLCKTYNSIDDKEKIKDAFTFPGAGDNNKNNGDNKDLSVAWADLYIYHEVIRQIAACNKNALFLTREKSKNDWLHKDSCLPFVHYITNAYVLTGKMLYILNSERFLAPSFMKDVRSIDDSDLENKVEESSIIEVSEDNRSGEIGVSIAEIGLSKPLQEATNQPQLLQEHKSDILLIKIARYTKDWRKITESEFIENLRFSEQWSEKFGKGFVGTYYFINDILGNKNAFDLKTSWDMLEILIQKKIIDRQTLDVDGTTVDTIRLVKK